MTGLLNATGHPKVEKWVQFPKALFVFRVVPGDRESGAFYLHDRRSKIWFPGSTLRMINPEVLSVDASDSLRRTTILETSQFSHLLPV